MKPEARLQGEGHLGVGRQPAQQGSGAKVGLLQGVRGLQPNLQAVLQQGRSARSVTSK